MTDTRPQALPLSSPGRMTFELTPQGHEPGRRADAVRNREKVLTAAAKLFAEHGAERLTMDAVAAAACVGKGTLFRHFGDRSGLLLAILDEAECSIQEAFLSGPPPLGPGAEPLARLRAFGPAVLRHEEKHADIYLASQVQPERRYLIPPYRVRLTHVAMLLRQIDPTLDADVLAHTLLAYLDKVLVHHLIRQREVPMTRLEEGWADLVARLTRTSPPE